MLIKKRIVKAMYPHVLIPATWVLARIDSQKGGNRWISHFCIALTCIWAVR